VPDALDQRCHEFDRRNFLRVNPAAQFKGGLSGQMRSIGPLFSVNMRNEATAWTPIFGAWLIASVSTLGALFFGEVI